MVYTQKPLSELVQEALSPNPNLRHVLTADMFTPDLLDQLYQRAEQLGYDVLHARRNRRIGNILQGSTMHCLFEKESTRTFMSFKMAGKHLGMSVEGTQGMTYSSEAKGESREDTFSSLSAYLPSVFVYRSAKEGAVADAAKSASVPIINGGDGSGEHPTQALLDVFTILQEVGRLNNLRIAIIGDLWNSRVARSDAILLSKFSGNHFDFISPEEFRMRDDILRLLSANGTSYDVHRSMHPTISGADIVMILRLQIERATPEQIQLVTTRPDVIERYSLRLEDAEEMRPEARIIHPLPRVDELSVDIDPNPRAAYKRQMMYGMFVRMALIEWVLGAD